MRGFLHLSVGLLALTTVAVQDHAPASPPGIPATGDATFAIMLRGVRIGTERVSLVRTDNGWRVTSTSQQNLPVDMQGGAFDIAYTADWSPRRLSVDGTLRGQLLRLRTTFSDTSATNEITDSTDPTKTTTTTQPVSARTVVLPSGFYGAYEALAARLSAMAVGDSVSLYLAPTGEARATLKAIAPRTIATPARRVELREFDLEISTGVPQPVQVWVDDRNRLAQMALPTAGVAIARDDLATVMAREELVHNPGDTSTFLPMPSFNIGATITVPTSAGPHPAVILVPGYSPQDRDMVVGGVPVFGLLAGALADAGNVVVRYDRRGVGQSGGRTENATLEDYRDDLIEIVKAVRKRKDVDRNRVAVVGYQDGGAIALLAAAKDDDIKAVALVAVPGSTGRDYVMEQQVHALATLPISAEERTAKIQMERQVVDASLTGTGWDRLPADVVHGADQAIFKSWLLFDPIKAVSKVDQPMLVMQGLADAELPRAHADRLLAAARARKRPPTATGSALLAGVSHTLRPAAASTGQMLAPEATTALVDWMNGAFRRGR